MTRRAALVACVMAAGAWPAVAGAAAMTAGPRIEARSASLLAVGLVDHDRMTIRVSRLADNAPVTNAAVTVKFRGSEHPATAQVDGSYAFESKDLGVPGRATVQITVREGGASDVLIGTLQAGAEPGTPEDKNGTRQLLWWVLNFGVCIGFLWLVSRRRKAPEDP